MPNVSGRAPEAKGWKVKFPQPNHGRGREAQDLLIQTDRERGAYVLLIIEQ